MSLDVLIGLIERRKEGSLLLGQSHALRDHTAPALLENQSRSHFRIAHPGRERILLRVFAMNDVQVMETSPRLN